MWVLNFLSLKQDEVGLRTTSRKIRNGREVGVMFANSDFPHRHSLGA